MILKTGDFRELQRKLRDNSVDAIITDPPFHRKYYDLWGDISWVAARLLKPGGWLVLVSGTRSMHHAMMSINGSMGWHTAIPIVSRDIGWCRQTLVYNKGMVPSKPMATAISGRPDFNWHKWGLSYDAGKSLVQQFTDEGDTVLDLCVGGGTFAKASQELGREFVGFDIDPKAIHVTECRLGMHNRMGQPIRLAAECLRDNVGVGIDISRHPLAKPIKSRYNLDTVQTHHWRRIYSYGARHGGTLKFLYWDDSCLADHTVDFLVDRFPRGFIRR